METIFYTLNQLFKKTYKLSKEKYFIPVKLTYKDINIADIFMRDIFKLHGIPKTSISD